MPKTGAAAVIRAADQVKSAERRVDDARRALTKAEKARDRADAAYLAMLRASLPGLHESARAGAEVAEQTNG